VTSYEFTYEFTDNLARQAARQFLIHHLHWRVRVAAAAYVLLLLLLCGADAPGYACGIFSGAGGLLALLVAVGYLVRARGSRQLWRRMPTRTVRCVLSEAGFHLESALGSSELPWHLLVKVVRGPDVWLFFIDRQQNFSVPGDKLKGDVGRFVERQVAAAGGRLFGDAAG
jgi:hypothetical protein